MRWLHKLLMQLRMLFRRNEESARLNDELQFHLEQQIAENMATGMHEEEARHAAMRSFGSPAVLRDQTRNTWSWNWLESLFRDARISARTLRRAPGFAVMAVVVMALCLGAATSLFTIARGVLLKSLPFRDPDKLVMVYEHFHGYDSNREAFNYNVVSPADYYDWRTQTHGFEDMAAWRWDKFNFSGEHAELPEVITAAAGTWNFFSVLGVNPVLGRIFYESEDHPGANRVVMLTWGLFQRRFGGDPSVIGKQIHLDANPYTVIGVLPQSFAYPDATVQVWVPYASGVTAEYLSYHDHHQSHVVARLKPNVSLQNAISQVEAVQHRLHMENLDKPVAEDAVSRPLLDDVVHDIKTPLVILLCAVGCMLFIGCLNVANLLIARAATRQKEIAIRGALGAGRVTLIRQQMVESLLICFAGGALGVLLSFVATKWLTSAWKDLPRTEAIHVDMSVLAFSFVLICLSALLAGLLPALLSTQKSAFVALHDSSRSVGGSLARTTLRRTLLTIEIAVTVVLLIAAGLLLKSFARIHDADLGATTTNVLTLHYDLPKRQYDQPEKVVAFNETLLESLRHMPGVRAVGVGSVVPGAGYGGDDVFTIPEHPPVQPGQDLPDAIYRMADPGYFTALQIPLLRGRFFTDHDRLNQSNYVIISRQLANQYFTNENPIGWHLHVPAWNSGLVDYEIIGVVGDTLYQADKPLKATMYFPVFAGYLDRDYTLIVRTAFDPLKFSLPVQKEIASLDPTLPMSEVLTMQQIIGESAENTSFSATILLSFALLSLLLAAVGLYGVLSYLVTQRTTEIGIRLALGAQREQVVRLMLGDGLRPALFGLVFGLLASIALTRLIQSMLFRTSPFDLWVFALVAAILLFVAAVACALPARRASRLDPMQALRTE
ncbi:ABC transporter permease [Alloacidobacterium sp.]|uniref:ABC transporter permease n=1 Tax=Alloacidobacterium sp. TaxID=2951999 RepID=UPI002D737AD8|nr:ABC transporter permease [Alloacidobacterium sp.]HYK37341.1 ABC transporter permease [Alloacidobacterium sp.]